MKASLISRDLIADSIELVARGNLFDGLIALSGCDKTIPGHHHGARPARYSRRDAVRRLDCARRVSRPQRDHSGRLRSGGRALVGQDVRRRSAHHGKPGVSRAPARAAGSSPRTPCPPWASSSGISAMGFNDVPAIDPEKARIGREAGALVMDLLKTGSPSAAADHARLDRERHRVGGRHRRIDQRGAAPAGDCARGRRGAEHRRLRPHQREGAAAGGSEAERPVRRHGHVQGRRRGADREPAQGSRTAARIGDDRDGPARLARRPTASGSRRARKWSGRCRIR